MRQADGGDGTTGEIVVRPVAEADLARLTAIYAHHVRHGTASFELEPPDAAEMARRREGVLALGLPYLVATAGGAVVGFAYAGPYRPRPAYRYTVEDSVYVDPACVGRGIGRALLTRLIEACTARGYRQMVAVIGDSAQHASIRLHEACGFTQIGTLRDVGFKFGGWLDVVLMQRPLGPGAGAPP